MAKIYYNSKLTGEEIEKVLESVDNISNTKNSGLVVGINTQGELEAVENGEGSEYSAGTGIHISSDKEISCTLDVKTYSAGTGITISSDNVISCSFLNGDEVSY